MPGDVFRGFSRAVCPHSPPQRAGVGGLCSPETRRCVVPFSCINALLRSLCSRTDGVRGGFFMGLPLSSAHTLRFVLAFSSALSPDDVKTELRDSGMSSWAVPR